MRVTIRTATTTSLSDHLKEIISPPTARKREGPPEESGGAGRRFWILQRLLPSSPPSFHPTSAMSFFTFDGSFLKLNLSFPPVLGGAAFVLKTFLNSPFADAAVAAMPVEVDKVPFFVIVVLPIFAWVIAVLAIIVISASSKDGYSNSDPRSQKGESLKEVSSVAWRMHCAHNNGLEFVVMAAPCFFTAITLGLESVLFAKLSVTTLICRVLYTFFYIAGLDPLRTFIFIVACFATFAIGLAPLFPDLIPLLS